MKRPARQRRIGGEGAPDVGQRHDNGVQHWVGGVDAGDRAIRELGRRDLTVGDQIAQGNRVKPAQIVGGHGRSLCDLARTPRPTGRVQRRVTSFYDATFSGREVLRSPGAEQLCVRLDCPSDADGETVHQPPVAMPDCIRSRERLQHWDPFAPPA